MIKVNRYKCGYCGACVSICPMDALDLVETYIEVDDKYSNCGICTKVCPMGALDIKNEE